MHEERAAVSALGSRAAAAITGCEVPHCVDSSGSLAVPRTTAAGATSPFVQGCLNDRLPHAYLPLVLEAGVVG